MHRKAPKEELQCSFAFRSQAAELREREKPGAVELNAEPRGTKRVQFKLKANSDLGGRTDGRRQSFMSSFHQLRHFTCSLLDHLVLPPFLSSFRLTRVSRAPYTAMSFMSSFQLVFPLLSNYCMESKARVRKEEEARKRRSLPSPTALSTVPLTVKGHHERGSVGGRLGRNSRELEGGSNRRRMLLY